MEWLANIQIEYIIAAVIVLFLARLALARYKTPTAKSAAEIVESALIAIVLVFLIIRPFVVQAFYIPSESMVPTLEISDHILVNKFIYRFREPRHGDIIVFKSPPGATEAHSEGITPAGSLTVDPMNRERAIQDWNLVIGTVDRVSDSGDVSVKPNKYFHAKLDELKEFCIEGKDGDIKMLSIENIRRDGDNLNVKFVDTDPNTIQELQGGKVRIGEKDYIKRVVGIPGDTIEVKQSGVDENGTPVYSIFRNGKQVKESYINETPNYIMPSVKIDKGMLLVMGDNRNNSNDGHRWGPFRRERVVGKAMVTFWPLNRMGLLR